MFKYATFLSFHITDNQLFNKSETLVKYNEPLIFGDGETYRAFTYIANIVLANKLVFFTDNKDSLNIIFNGWWLIKYLIKSNNRNT